jgi:undecaprenyl phosphate-alpha-L-ara4N flippase subunit ArnE
MDKYFALLAMCLFVTIGQLSIKIGALKIKSGMGFLSFVKSFLNAPLILGGVSVLVAPVFYFYALTKVNLSIAYGFTGLNYVFVFMGSWLILKEKVSVYHFIGIFLIFFGVLLVNL